MLIVLMGVTGCGKTTIGSLLASQLNKPFVDADNYHPIENIEKMQNGIPLDDTDRYDWLITLGDLLKRYEAMGGVILACSALKESYRVVLQKNLSYNIQWVFLDGSVQVIKSRLEKRSGHFMPTKLINSQFTTLEIPDYALRISIEKEPFTIVQEIIDYIK